MKKIKLMPGNEGKDCPGNGTVPGIECQCDECDYLMCCILRTKTCTKFQPFQVFEFLECGFLVAQGKNTGNTLCISEYFNTAEAEIRL